MFSQILINDNEALVDYAFYLHKHRLIEPDTYLLDYDTIISNYNLIYNEAKKYNIDTFVMTKQFGRHQYLIKGLSKLGAKFVAVDFREAKKIATLKGELSHVGHLVQIPITMINTILEYRPKFITVYSLEQVKQINNYAFSKNFIQNIFIRIIKTAYNGQESFIYNDEYLLSFAKETLKYKHIKLIGLTTFPCFLFDENTKQVVYTDNAKELIRCYDILKNNGFDLSVKNMPSHNNYSSIPLINSLGATQIEPGHAITGTCPYHAYFPNAKEEKIAIAYVSEVSHHDEHNSYIFGGGHYRRSNWSHVYSFQKKSFDVIFPDNTSIDYTIAIRGKIPIGETVISSFRTQVFVTRSQVALIKGLSKNNPRLSGICDSEGNIIKEE